MQDYIWLNDVRLPIVGAVRWKRITPFPDQFITQAPQESDYTPTRKQNWGSLKDGMGKEKWSEADNSRYWDCDDVDASQTMQTLGPLVTTLGTFGAEPVKIIKYDGRIWAIGHLQISYWDGEDWQSVKTDFANPTDAITFYGTT